MKKPELAAKIAAKSDVSPEEAADALDRIAHRILKRLKKGKVVNLPGLGRFLPGPKTGFEFESQPQTKAGSKPARARR
jgi:nucleoid DNA-binding protein